MSVDAFNSSYQEDFRGSIAQGLSVDITTIEIVSISLFTSRRLLSTMIDVVTSVTVPTQNAAAIAEVVSGNTLQLTMNGISYPFDVYDVNITNGGETAAFVLTVSPVSTVKTTSSDPPAMVAALITASIMLFICLVLILRNMGSSLINRTDDAVLQAAIDPANATPVAAVPLTQVVTLGLGNTYPPLLFPMPYNRSNLDIPQHNATDMLEAGAYRYVDVPIRPVEPLDHPNTRAIGLS
jgi:hypothetical protein